MDQYFWPQRRRHLLHAHHAVCRRRTDLRSVPSTGSDIYRLIARPRSQRGQVQLGIQEHRACHTLRCSKARSRNRKLYPLASASHSPWSMAANGFLKRHLRREWFLLRILFSAVARQSFNGLSSTEQHRVDKRTCLKIFRNDRCNRQDYEALRRRKA